MVDFSLKRANVVISAGYHGDTLYARCTGRIVILDELPDTSRPYGVRINGCPRWDIHWFSRKDFEVVN